MNENKHTVVLAADLNGDRLRCSLYIIHFRLTPDWSIFSDWYISDVGNPGTGIISCIHRAVKVNANHIRLPKKSFTLLAVEIELTIMT